MTIYKKFLFTIALFTFLAPANASFREVQTSGVINCENNTRKATLKFNPGAPSGTYSATLKASTENTSDISIEGIAHGVDGFTKEFKIPRDENSGLEFSFTYSLDKLQAMGTFEAFTIPLNITPGDTLTEETGFGTATGEITVNDTGCSDSSEPPTPETTLDDTLEGADQPSFEPINVNDLVSSDVDLVVNFTYKVNATAYNLVVGDLKEGENITDKAKALAEKFAIKLDIKGLKKLAFKELKAATKGLSGEEKAAAEAAARETGLNKLLAEIKLKLPELPAKDGENIEAIQKIRQAQKKKILEALSVELVSVTDTEDNSQKCLTFKVTLPAKVCANTDGSKTLVIAGQAINIMNLEPGETFTVDIPVQVLGVFQEFFGVETAARARKGLKGPNGKTTIEFTLTNPVTE